NHPKNPANSLVGFFDIQPANEKRPAPRTCPGCRSSPFGGAGRPTSPRQAHNLKVTGSNPVPATIQKTRPVLWSGFLISSRQTKSVQHRGLVRAAGAA